MREREVRALEARNVAQSTARGDYLTHDQSARAVVLAWTEPGANPEYHYNMKRKVSRRWPALANAIEALTKAKP